MSRKPLCVNGNMTTLAPGFETRKARLVATPQLRACTALMLYTTRWTVHKPVTVLDAHTIILPRK